MVDELPDSSPAPSSDGRPPKKSDAGLEVLPKSKDKEGPRPKDAAGHFMELMAVESGNAALASSFERLPESTQKQVLDNQAQRDRLAYDFEGKRLAAEAADRESERKDQLIRFQKTTDHEAAHKRRVFWAVVAGGVVGAIGAGLLGWVGQWEAARHLINSLVAGGLGFLAGRGATKVGKQRQLPPGGKDKDDDQ